ncbi:DUF6262 family protein [Paenibacillus amylolyticus]|uniref:Uncharacterized protein n=1 Tax=Paenibacillus amylolyticus TaxID=1451 RepID=A0A124DY56_PAEAM|nr:DUF6262 family protein [Paenibacillus amylolyticus]GAS83163.1 unknown protein [Paenibacillus amylolyticus]
MKKRSLPEELLLRQEIARQETLTKLQNAIDDLNSEGALVTLSKLVVRTGLSRSTLNKSHVKKFLMKNKIGKYNLMSVPNEELTEDTEELKMRIVKLTQQLKKETERYKIIKEEQKLLSKNYEFLLGKYHRAVMIAFNHGIPIDIPDIESEKEY